MANRYSQLTQAPYVRQYAPAPIDQFSQIAQQSRQRFEQSQLQDAQTKALAMRALGTASTEDEREMVGEIVNPVLDQLDQRAEEGDYHDALLEARTLGMETSSRIQALQDARSKKSNLREQILEENPDVDSEELQYRIQRNLPDIQLDSETRYPSLSRDTENVKTRFAPDVSISEKLNQALSGIKPRGYNTTFQFDPDRGVLYNQEGEEIKGERVRRLAQQVIDTDPEIQGYLNRREEYYTMLAEDAMEQGSDPLDNLMSSYEQMGNDEASSEVRRKVERLRNRNYSDAEIYGRILRENELDNAVGFAEGKFSFSDVSENVRNPSTTLSDRIEEMGQMTSGTMRAGRKTNPYSAGLPEELDFSMEFLTSRGEGSRSIILSTGEGAGASSGPGTYERHRPVDVSPEESTDVMLEGIENSEQKSIVENVILPSISSMEEGEDFSNYRERVEKAYNNYMKGFKETNSVARRIDDPEGDVRNKWFGNPDDPSIGRAESLTYYNMTPGSNKSYTEPRSLTEIAEELGMTPDEFANNVSVQGKFGRDDGLAPGGLYVTVTGVDAGWFGDEHETADIKVSPNNIEEERDMAARSEIAKLEMDPTITEGREIQANIEGRGRTIFRPVKDVVFVNSEDPDEQVSGDHPNAEPKTRIRLISDQGDIINQYVGEGFEGQVNATFKAIMERGTLQNN